MAIIQISRVQNTRGSSSNLPTLQEGEIGMTTDTGEVFIGAPNHPSVSGRSSYPYQNIKFITELDLQKSITGDVYYHGPLLGNNITSGLNKVCIPLFAHNSIDFANYDFSITNSDGSMKTIGQLMVLTDKNTISSSVVKVINVTSLGWTPSLVNSFSLSQVDDQNLDSGITWLKFYNNFGQDLTLAISGREWTTPPFS